MFISLFNRTRHNSPERISRFQELRGAFPDWKESIYAEWIETYSSPDFEVIYLDFSMAVTSVRCGRCLDVFVLACIALHWFELIILYLNHKFVLSRGKISESLVHLKRLSRDSCMPPLFAMSHACCTGCCRSRGGAPGRILAGGRLRFSLSSLPPGVIRHRRAQTLNIWACAWRQSFVPSLKRDSPLVRRVA